ncbi:MAG: hypothetical protein ABSA92_12385 [Candidatus Bathyarchaeia archaeon]|jgi:hypothetical protein
MKRRHRFTKRERESRIYNRIKKAGKRGISVGQIASRERLSKRQINRYLRQLHKDQAKHKRKIAKLGRKYYPIRPIKVPARTEPATTAIWKPRLPGAQAELRAYVNYASSQPSRSIDIDCVIIVPNDNSAILSGSEQIKEIVEARLGTQIASMLKFGISEATANSTNHFLYRRRGGSWVAF